MKINTLVSALAFGVIGVLSASDVSAQGRDQIRVVGSSTVYPFTTAVAEAFGRTGGRTPVVEQQGTGAGFKIFCAGVGAAHPDVANASRRINQTEFDECKKNGVTDIVELKIGFDGIVLANAKAGAEFKLTLAQVFLALAKQVPDRTGKLVANPNQQWSDIDPSLPRQRIEVLGPPPSSGTRDAFLELVMQRGAERAGLADLKRSDAKAFETAWKSIREDGAYIDAGENDNLIVQKLTQNPNAIGIFGYSFLEENQAAIKGAAIEGTAPNYDAIASGKYPVSRPLFVYVKKQHIGVIPGLDRFVAEYVKGMAEDAYLSDKGLITLPKAELDRVNPSQSLTTLGS